MIFDSKCTYEEKYLKYTTEIVDNQTYITPDLNSGKVSFCPFDNALEMVIDYLNIGYAYDRDFSVENSVLDFVGKYGFPTHQETQINVYAFAEDAQMLYLHFAEISKAPYPNDPEFILETDPVAAVIKVADETKYIEWQTVNLSSAIELAYTLLLCGRERVLGICKYCGAPFYTKNPKAEFCSQPCRNKYNVYKTRAKKKLK